MMQICGIGLATPGVPINQSDLLDIACSYNAATDRERTKLKRIYRGSQVKQRHTVLSGGATGPQQAIDHILSFYQATSLTRGPSTRQRMAMYEAKALPLAAAACRQALLRSNTPPDSITHLITVSCTGFSAPGLDAGLIDTIELSPSVGRTHIGFMGCHGAINGLRIADALTTANTAERVLLCSTELCTLHFQYGCDPQDTVANALFADGSAAVVGSSPSGGASAPTTKAFHSCKLAATQDKMSWRVGDHGFQMRLEPQVPEIILQELKPVVANWLAGLSLGICDIAGWAIHPGGPKIIDAVEQSLGLPPRATQASRVVLREYGNMSSPTVLYILDQLCNPCRDGLIVVMGFGPGLTVELALLAVT